MDGSDLIPFHESQLTIYQRLKNSLSRYRSLAASVVAVMAILAVLAAKIYDPIGVFMKDNNVVGLLTLLVVLDIAASSILRKGTRSSSVSKNQDKSLSLLIRTVPRCRTEGVFLLEYAGATILPLIREIQRSGVPLRMLVKHPDTVNGLQRHRMVATIDTIVNSIFGQDPRMIELRCYRLPYTLRGRRLGSELLELGWLTPDLKNNTAFGHQNPSILADISVKDNDHLASFFNRTFDDLWEAPDTEEAKKVLLRFQQQEEPSSQPSNLPDSSATSD